MEPSNNSSSQDVNNCPRVDRGQGTEERGGTRDTHSGRGNCRKGNQYKCHSPRHLDFEVSYEIQPLFFLFEFPQQIKISYEPNPSFMQSKF